MNETQRNEESTSDNCRAAPSESPAPETDVEQVHDDVTDLLLSIDPFSPSRLEELRRRRESGELCENRYELNELYYFKETELDRQDIEQHGEAVELTQEEVEQMGGFSYLNAAGKRIEITPESFPSSDAVLILFPEDLWDP